MRLCRPCRTRQSVLSFCSAVSSIHLFMDRSCRTETCTLPDRRRRCVVTQSGTRLGRSPIGFLIWIVTASVVSRPTLFAPSFPPNCLLFWPVPTTAGKEGLVVLVVEVEEEVAKEVAFYLGLTRRQSRNCHIFSHVVVVAQFNSPPVSFFLSFFLSFSPSICRLCVCVCVWAPRRVSKVVGYHSAWWDWIKLTS